MSDRKKARRALKDFVLRTAETLPNTAPEDQYVRTPNGRLFLQDLRTLLQAEREARHVARRVIREKLELQRAAQRNKDAFLRERAERLRRGQEISELQTENADLRNTVSELSRKIQDPPGSHERWQKLRSQNASLAAQRDSLQTSLAQAETQIRKQADQLRNLPTPEQLKQERAAANAKIHEYANQLLALPTPDEWAAAQARLRELSDALARACTSTPGQQELERVRTDAQEQRERANRAETEVARQAGLLRGAHKDVERLERLAKDRNSDLQRLTAERDRANEALARYSRGVSAPGGLSAEELRKVAQDLLPQFLATFLSPPWDKT